MEITVGLFLTLLALAFACEFVDSSLGMGYGTILTPCLLIMGFSPVVAVPAVLLSQAMGGLAAAVFHHTFQNVSFRLGSRDLKLVILLSGLGVVASALAALLSVSIPPDAVRTYIGVLVLVIGILLAARRLFRFSWKRMIWVGIVSAFNKGIAGGGFGPVVTGGQILSGQNQRAAVGVTTLAEAPICIAGFLAYVAAMTAREAPGAVREMPVSEFFHRTFIAGALHWELILALILGSLLVAPLGALTTRALRTDRLHRIVALLMIALGALTLAKTWL